MPSSTESAEAGRHLWPQPTVEPTWAFYLPGAKNLENMNSSQPWTETAAREEEHTAQGRERTSYPIKAVRDASPVILSLKLHFLNTFQMNENHPGLPGHLNLQIRGSYSFLFA